MVDPGWAREVAEAALDLVPKATGLRLPASRLHCSDVGAKVLQNLSGWRNRHAFLLGPESPCYLLGRSANLDYSHPSEGLSATRLRLNTHVPSDTALGDPRPRIRAPPAYLQHPSASKLYPRSRWGSSTGDMQVRTRGACVTLSLLLLPTPAATPTQLGLGFRLPQVAWPGRGNISQ